MYSKLTLLSMLCFWVYMLAMEKIPDNKEHLYKSLLEMHFKKLPYVSVPHNKPLVICFSGTPGMGKTYIAKKIEEKYQGLRISTDEVREILREQGIATQGESIIEGYLAHALRSNYSPNKLIILDCSIDRRAKTLLPYLKAHAIPYLVIRIEASCECARERISVREGENKENYFRFLPSWYHDYESFVSSYTPNCTISNEHNEPPILDGVFEKIDAALLVD